MKLLTAASLVATLAASALTADEFTPLIHDFYNAEVSSWAQSDVLVRAITEQNARTMAFDQNQIEALDQAWRAEVGTGSTPTITPVLQNAASDFLRHQVASSGGRITEVFIMDAQGLNVAASDTTSDYWQGDEEKFSATHGAGPGAVHVSEVELDESTQRYQAQLSFTITDPATGAAIGAMTIGVDAESLM